MRSFKTKKDEVLNHWIAFVEGFGMPPGEFYGAVEKELTTRKIPGLEISRVEYAEGGLLSDRRTYLRMIRERLAFDTCASPFGTGYFFSCRTVYSPAVVRWWHLLMTVVILYIIAELLVRPLGYGFAGIAVAGLILAVVMTFQNAAASKVADVDAALLKVPFVGPIYECWFRLDTYYRQDTRLVYLETIPALVRKLAEHVTADQGLKLVPQYQRAPVLGELYRPVAARPKEPPPDEA